MPEQDLDSEIKPWHSGSTKQAILKEITIVCAAELSVPHTNPRTERRVERILKLAEEGLSYG